MKAANEVTGLLDRLKEARLPVCPRARPARGEWLHPVDGYCVLGCRPGYMIPSVGEFRAYCTTSGYARCPWFSAHRSLASAVSSVHGTGPEDGASTAIGRLR